MAGVRWYEIRRLRTRNRTTYSVYQQGTYAPDDGVHRWMGSAAMDRQGNMGLGYSVSTAWTSTPAFATPGGSRAIRWVR